MPYVGESERNWGIDALAYHNLSVWVDAGHQFLEKQAHKGVLNFREQGLADKRRESRQRLQQQQDVARKEQEDKAAVERERRAQQLRDDTSAAELRRNNVSLANMFAEIGLNRFDYAAAFEEMGAELVGDLIDEPKVVTH